MAPLFTKNSHSLSRETVLAIASVLPHQSRVNFALTLGSIYLDDVLRDIWRHLKSPFPVFSLIRGLKCASMDQWSLSNSVKTADLQRFQYYASFVKQLAFPSTPSNLNSIVFDIFRRSGYLFPSLIECHFGQSVGPINFSIPTVLTQLSCYVETVVAHLPPSSMRSPALWPTSLRSITLSGVVSAADLSLLVKCTTLRSLIILPDNASQSSSLTAAAIAVANRNHRIMTLGLRVKGLASFFGERNRNVSTLALRGSPRDLTSTLSCFSGLHQVTLDFGESGVLQVQSILACLSDLVFHSRTTLARVSIHSDWDGEEDFPWLDCLQILSPLRNLRSLTMLCPQYGEVGDGVIRRICEAWPHVEDIHLDVHVSHSGLRLLAGWPHLKHLVVNVKECGSSPSCQFRFPFRESFHDPRRPELDNVRERLERKLIPAHSRKIEPQSHIDLGIDVFQSILDFADATDLYNLLQVSMLFYIMSRKRLWRTLPSLVPLVKLLPGTISESFGVYCWDPPTTPYSFDRYDCHSAFVETVAHQITSRITCCESIHPSVFEQLRMLHPGRMSLPKLSVLKCCLPLFATTSYNPFLSEHLRTLSLDIKSDCTQDVLVAALSLSTRLEQLKLSGFLTAELLDPLRNFKALSALSLKFDDVYYDTALSAQYQGRGAALFRMGLSTAFEALGHMPGIKTLAYNIPYVGASTPVPDGRWCQRVTNLRVQGPPGTIPGHLLKFSNLQSASLYLDEDLDSLWVGDFLADCCRALVNSSASSLRALSITCEQSTQLHALEHAQPLLEISAMEHFSLKLNSGEAPVLRRDDAYNIATHWPDLQEFTLMGGWQQNQVDPAIHELLPLRQLSKLKGVRLEGLFLPGDPKPHHRNLLEIPADSPIQAIAVAHGPDRYDIRYHLHDFLSDI